MAQNLDELHPSEIPIIAIDTPCPTVEEMMAPVVSEIKKPKLCNLESLIPSTTARIIREHPNTELVKGIIMNLFGQSPPIELKTYDEIREWIETTFTKTVEKQKEPLRATVARPSLDVTMLESQVASGRCRYRQDQSRFVTRSYTLDDIRDLIGEGVSSIDEMVDKLKHLTREDIDSNGGDGDWSYGDESTSDHNDEDVDDHDLSFTNETNLNIRNWLHANLTQRMRDELGM